MTVFSVPRKKKDAEGNASRPHKPRHAPVQRAAAPAEAERDLLLGVMAPLDLTRDVNGYLAHLVELLQDYSRCGSIGVRLLDDEGNIPYACYSGFSREFYRSEDRLSTHRDRCFCINVITRDLTPGLPCYTEGGSFLSNGLSKLLGSIPSEKAGRTGRVCKRFGYETMALVPLRRGETTLGLIQLADESEDRIPPEKLRILERVGSHVAETLHLFLTEEALRRSQASVQGQMETLKDEFLDIASHEMRSPLTVIVGAVNTALSELPRLSPDETRQLLQDAASEAETLSSLLANFLELSRAQAGRLALEQEPVNVKKSAQEAVRKVEQQCPGRRFVVDFPKRLPRAFADEPRVERIIANLLENAARYTPEGGEIRVSARPETGRLVVAVSDQRVGTSPQDMPDAAALEHPDDPQSIRGAGLGLLVCRKLVEAHGGRIWAEQGDGGGCEFLFTLPWRPAGG